MIKRSTASRLNDSLISLSDIHTAPGRYDSRTNSYRFPDGSAGRLITFHSNGFLPSSQKPVIKFVELKIVPELAPVRPRVSEGRVVVFPAPLVRREPRHFPASLAISSAAGLLAGVMLVVKTRSRSWLVFYMLKSLRSYAILEPTSRTVRAITVIAMYQ